MGRSNDFGPCDRVRGVVEIARAPFYMQHAKRLSQVNDGKAVFAVTTQWVVIAIAMGAAIHSQSALVYGLAMVTIATRQHALGVLMHDASHFKLFSNRLLNDIVGNLLCALPVGMTVARYRTDHFKHHLAPNTDRDPYFLIFRKNPRCWQWPKSKHDACGVLLRDLAGLNLRSMMRETWAWGPFENHFSTESRPAPLTLTERITCYGFIFVVLGTVTLVGGWPQFLLLWALPFITISTFLIRIRSLAEHFGLPNEVGNDATRHVDGAWYERLAFAPLNANYHLVHHLFPAIPQYNLPEMNWLLFADPEFRKSAHRCKTYYGVMHELIVEPANALS
jgi:fatty acid desaturase